MLGGSWTRKHRPVSHSRCKSAAFLLWGTRPPNQHPNLRTRSQGSRPGWVSPGCACTQMCWGADSLCPVHFGEGFNCLRLKEVHGKSSSSTEFCVGSAPSMAAIQIFPCNYMARNRFWRLNEDKPPDPSELADSANQDWENRHISGSYICLGQNRTIRTSLHMSTLHFRTPEQTQRSNGRRLNA